MSESANRHRAPARNVVLDGELTIYRAAELRESLLAALAADNGPDAIVDLSGVSEIDSAGVQLLLALQRDTIAAGGAFAVKAASEPVADVVAMLGLAGLLDTAAADGRCATEEAAA